ncbi:fused MFS/spermidine synthase [Phenylobacterium sp.]|jgi:SAM-dependent methyltransferase|uniref:spermidine synthase n=1 Tax=Phenylobacterium sp. TaxID=1871053 RepID=UPI002F935428
MTSAAAVRPAARPPEALFAITVFSSAALVFLVQPMVAKLVLPLLGGSPSVWNTSMVFFQAALLAGYGYAHALQRIASVRTQALVHCAALLVAALALPLRVNELLGQPSVEHPNLWLLGVLALSIGAPFAVLSATAPLVQAWHARTVGNEDGKEPYVLYAASNLGSLLALLAYPIAVEPALTLAGQKGGWSLGYAAFVALMAGLALFVGRARTAAAVEADSSAPAPPITWRDRLAWVALAAIPSSLMLGVTTHITTDVASAPFLWVVPLALYLATFIIAFQARPLIPPDVTLLLQAAAVAACAAMLPFKSSNYLMQLGVHLAAFFLTALMCHQTLVARRPDPRRLTEFYLLMSLGGVLGGAFNALLAPVIFSNIWEYPAVLALSCLVRPMGPAKVGLWDWTWLFLGVAAAAFAPVVMTFIAPSTTVEPVLGNFSQRELVEIGTRTLLATAVVSAFLLRRYAIMFFGVIVVISVCAQAVGNRVEESRTWRSFFGVLEKSHTYVPGLNGRVNMLAHGTTLHGAQATAPEFRCSPLVYYTPNSPIGQVFDAVKADKPAIRVAAVGLGTGTVAAYTRPGDHLTFFEIDPLVVKVSTDPKNFSYTTECAKGRIDYVLGDARLTVAKQPKALFDVMLIDAFSSDAVPAHLLTVEAVRDYLTHLTPDGVLILHLSNRNLDLMGPAQAVAAAAGGVAMVQEYRPGDDPAGTWESAEDAVIVARSPAGMAWFADDPRWRRVDAGKARPWTDDYINIAGALYRRLKENWTWLP